jgi:hypothetical protein
LAQSRITAKPFRFSPLSILASDAPSLRKSSGLSRAKTEGKSTQSDLTNVVATGLWPVRLGAAFYTKENGPQDRGYGGYRLILIRSKPPLMARIVRTAKPSIDIRFLRLTGA